MKRLRTWLRRLSLAALLVVALGLFAQFVIVPKLIQWRIVAALHAAGFAHSRVTVNWVSPWRLQATDLKLDAKSDQRIESVAAEFAPSTLVAGRINRLDLAGAYWTIRLTPAGLDLGLPPGLLQRRPTGNAPGRLALPVQRIVLRDGEVQLNLLSREIPLPIDGVLQQPAPDQLHLNATVHLPAAAVNLDAHLTDVRGRYEIAGRLTAPGLTMPVQGTIDPGRGTVHLAGQAASSLWWPEMACELDRAGSGDLHFQARVAAAAAGPATAPGQPRAASSPVGGLVVDYRRTAGKSHTTVTYTGRPGPVGLSGLFALDLEKADFHGELDGRGLLTRMDGDFQARRVQVGTYSLAHVQVTVHQAADGLDIQAAADGPGWRLESLRISSTQPRLDLSGRSPVTVAVAGSLGGRPTGWMQRWLGRLGIVMDKPGLVSLQGAGQAVWEGWGKAQPWRVQLGRVDLSVAPTDMALAWGGWRVEGMEGRFAGSMALAPGRCVLALNPQQATTIGWAGIQRAPAATQPVGAGAMPATMDVGPGRWTLTQSGEGLFSWSPSGIHLGATLTAEQPLELRTPEIEASARQAALALRLETSTRAPLRWISKLTLGQVAVVHKPTGLKVEDVALELPFTYGLKNPMVGSFQVGKVIYGKNPWPELSGSVDINNGVLKAAFATPEGASLKVNGTAELRLWDGPDGQVRISLLDYHIEDPQWLGRVAPQAADMQMTGRFDLYGVISFVKGRIEPWVTLVAHDAAVSSQDLDIGASGIEAVVNFNHLDPLGTPPFQWVTVKSAHSGRLKLTDGTVDFTMQTPQSVLIERADWLLGKTGKFWVHGVWIDPTAKNMNLEVFLENVNIKDLLALATDGSVTGDGVLLNGRVNVPLRPGQTPMLLPLKDGWLQSHEVSDTTSAPGTPSGGAGWIEVHDKQALVRMLGGGGGGPDQSDSGPTGPGPGGFRGAEAVRAVPDG